MGRADDVTDKKVNCDAIAICGRQLFQVASSVAAAPHTFNSNIQVVLVVLASAPCGVKTPNVSHRPSPCQGLFITPVTHTAAVPALTRTTNLLNAIE